MNISGPLTARPSRTTLSARVLCLFLLALAPRAAAQETWYRSNQAGMALERIPSRMTALHHEWSLSVEQAERRSLPALLRPFDDPAYTLEARFLYERGRLKRRQWIFRSGGVTRLNASLPAEDGEDGKAGDSPQISPFVELFGNDRALSAIYQYLPSGVYITRYAYREGLLTAAVTSLDKAALWTDRYRYTRSGLLRAVERDYHEAGAAAAVLQGQSALPRADIRSPLRSPPINPSLDLREAPSDAGFVNPASPYDASLMTEVLSSVYAVPAVRVIYQTDPQGRIRSETHYDEKDRVIAEIVNEWTGDRITRIAWSGTRYGPEGSPGSEEGRVVFRYSKGERIAEDDYRNGVLERTVRRQGDEDIEEIYVKGTVRLRAVWKDGRKMSEERLR
ncbi:MAG: hypothetical protein LBD09_03390 [Treponema sp.]|nr:hypothetical protein [Treponema sp.]